MYTNVKNVRKIFNNPFEKYYNETIEHNMIDGLDKSVVNSVKYDKGDKTDAWYAGNQLDEMYQAVVEDRYRSPYERWCGKKPHIDMFARFW